MGRGASGRCGRMRKSCGSCGWTEALDARGAMVLKKAVRRSAGGFIGAVYG